MRFTFHVLLVTETLQLRFHSSAAAPTLLYLPGLHGDWTLLGPFRHALAGRARLAEVTYPRRADWRLDDYAQAIEETALARGLTNLWLLAESFSSQVGWTLAGRAMEGRSPLRLEGLILAGGFIRHPWPWGVHLAHYASAAVPEWMLGKLTAIFGRYACRRCQAGPEIVTEIEECVRRRMEPCDRDAINSRYRLIAQADVRPIARRARLPVFHLSGAIDPLVPWWSVRRWLDLNCPGYRASRILPRCGHNHLLDAPAESARQILAWVGAPDSAPAR